MATLDDLKKQEPLWFKIQDFLKKTIKEYASLLWGIIGIIFIALSIISCRPFSFSNSIQIVLTIIVIALSAFNIYLIRYYKKGTSNTPFSAPSKLIILSIIIVLCAIALFVWNLKHTSLETNHSSMWIWLISIISLSLLNFVFPRLYQHKWDMPEVLRPLIHIEGLAVIIAILQLFIAIPQLESSLKASTSEDITTLGNVLMTFQKHLESYNSIEIPDSLVNKNVEKAQLFQKKIYTYSLYLYNIISTLNDVQLYNTNSMMNKYTREGNDNEMKENQWYKELSLLYNNAQRYKLIINLTETQISLNNYMVKTVLLLEEIDRYYGNSIEDSTLINSGMLEVTKAEILQKFALQLTNKKSYLTYSKKLNEDLVKFETLSKQNKYKWLLQLEMHKLNKKVEHNIINYQNLILNDCAAGISKIDELCLYYSTMLNVIQLKYAYNVDFTN